MNPGTLSDAPSEPATLPDYISEDIDILSIGLNPSPNSVRGGYPFATPQNRFWRALNHSRLVRRPRPPSVESMRRLLIEDRIGFTDLVKRPTAGASGLRADDYKQWAPILRSKIKRVRPRILWIHGKLAYRNLLRYGFGSRVDTVEWGEQPVPEITAGVFVTPNPSPANAVYSLEDIVYWYQRLAEFRAGVLDPAFIP